MECAERPGPDPGPGAYPMRDVWEVKERRAATLPIVRDEEQHQRLFFTRSDPRRVRTLKSLRLLPSTPHTVTYAEIGIQVAMAPDVQTYKSKIETMKDSLKNTVGVVSFTCADIQYSKNMLAQLEDYVDTLALDLTDLEDQLYTTNDDNMTLQYHLTEKEYEVETLRETLVVENHKNGALMTKLTKTEQEVGDLKGERSRLRSEVKDLQSTIDRFQLELAFLQEDKDYLETSVNDKSTTLEMVTSERNGLRKTMDHLKETILDNRLRATETLGKYLEELNQTLSEKRSLLKGNLTCTSNEVKKMLATTDDFIKLEEENHRLVDQVEVLSTQAVAQDLQLEQLQGQLATLTKIFEDLNTRGRNFNESDIFLGELQRAKELVERPVGVLGTAGTGSELFFRNLRVDQYKKNKSIFARKTASLPSSPSKFPRTRLALFKSSKPPLQVPNLKPVRSHRTVGKGATGPVAVRTEAKDEAQVQFYSPYTSPRGRPT